MFARSFRPVLPLIVCLTTGLCAPAVADETDDAVDNIVVTAARTTNVPAEIPNATSVIHRADIESRNDSSISELLRKIPGLHVTQPSGQGGVARVFVRGADLEMTMVLLDGVRVNDPNDSRGSAFDFSTVNLSDVERIEIVRGPQSAVYGSDALAGVINIISKSGADDFAVSVLAEAGTDNFFRGAADLSGPFGVGGGFSVRVATLDDGEPVSGTTFSSDSLSTALSLGNGDVWDLRLFGGYSDSDGTAYPEDSGGAELAVLREVDNRSAKDLRLAANASLAVARDWRVNVLASLYDHDSSFVSPGVAPGLRDPVPPNGADSSLERANLAVNAVVRLGYAVTATLGVDHHEENGASAGYVELAPGLVLPTGFDFDRSVTGRFAELHFKPDIGPTLLASVRHDDPDEVRGETTARAGILHEFRNGRMTLRANWGQGFSLPGFFALASPLVGNPDLRPETSESYDLGFDIRSADKRLGMTFTYFHNEFTNLIDFDAAAFSMVNRDRLEVDGVEMQLEYLRVRDFRVYLQATYLDPGFQNNGTPILQRPGWRGSANLCWDPNDRWLLDVSWLDVGRTMDSSIPTGDRVLGSYDRVDLTATYKPTEPLQLWFSIDNVLGEAYQEAVGFPSPGTRARVGVRYRF